MADTYTHKDLAALCGVSETTIKSYRRKFPGFIPVLTRGKPIRFKKEAGEVCLKIRDCFNKGMSVNETHRVLKNHFKEHREAAKKSPATPAPEGSVVSPEYLEKFFATAGQMMQGMASLATAQAKAERRLGKLEKAVETLIDIETRNSDAFAQLMTQLKAPATETSSTKPSSSEAGAAAAAPQVRARKIVNVKSPEGDVKSYALEKKEEEGEEPPAFERPTDAFLNTPIVIRNDQGEFLGVPGRLSVASFTEILVREAEEGGASHSQWYRTDDTWVFAMEAPGGDTHELFFETTTTPRGNLVVHLERLDVNGKETSPQFLQEFFRQVKDKI